jgi:hypothetical protein
MATLGELVASEGEYLGAPQRAELADGEDHAVGRPRLRRPPVAAWLDDRGGLAFAGSPAFVPDPGLARLGLAGLGPELRRHGLARRQASANMAGGVRPVSPSSMHVPPGCPVTPAGIIGRCHHCVIPISLTVSDATDLGKRYSPESRPTCPRSIRFAGSWCLPICWGRSRRRADAVHGGRSRRRPHRLVA